MLAQPISALTAKTAIEWSAEARQQTNRLWPVSDWQMPLSACLTSYEQALVQEWERQDALVQRTRYRLPHVDRVPQAIVASFRVYSTRADLVWANGATEASDLHGVRNMLDRCGVPVCLAWSVRDAALSLRWQDLDAQTSDPCRPLD